MIIEIKRMSENATIPEYQSDGAAAIDLHADILSSQFVGLDAHLLIPTGIAVHIKNSDVVGLVYTRSGNGIKRGVVLSNGTGVIDSDYQGEIFVSLYNTGQYSFQIEPGDRIAQMMFAPIYHPRFNVVTDFTTTSKRGDGGMGSTGK